MDGEIKPSGIGDIPLKGIYGPGRREAEELNKNPGKERAILKSKWALISAAGAGRFIGACANPNILDTPDAFAQNPPAIEMPDQRGPSRAETQGIVVPSPTTQQETSPTAQPSITPERPGIASDFTKFTTDQEFNPNAELQFSQEELEFLRQDWDRIVKIIQEKYGADMINRKVVFKKVSTQFKGGFGYTSISNGEAPDGSGRYVELQINQLNKGALWESHHLLGHILFHQGFVSLYREDVPEEQEKESEWLTRASEGMAEAIAYELDEEDDSLTQEQFRSRYPWQTRSYFDTLLKTELGQKIRQNPALAEIPFDHSRLAYDRAATAFLVLQDQLGNSLFPNISKPYRERAQAIMEIRSRRQGEKQSLSIDLVNQELGLTQWGHQAMLDKIEVAQPGFREALRKEPALYYKEVP